MRHNPFTLYFDMVRLAVDANTVVGMRMMRFALGGTAAMREAERMVSEKVQTAGALAIENAVSLGMGATPEQIGKKSVARYHKVVRANKRRLGRS